MNNDWRKEPRGAFMVNLLAIVFDGSKVLIGKRVSDQYIEELTWSFPGGRPTYDRSLEESLKDEVKKKTNIDIRILSLFHARLFNIRPEFMLLYYLAEPINVDILSGEKFFDVKWVEPDQVVSYFTTNIDEKISNVLRRLAIDSNYLKRFIT